MSIRRSIRISLLLVLTSLGGGCSASGRTAPAPASSPQRIEPLATPDAPSRTVALGTSVGGAPLTMHVFGDGPDVTLIFAAIHGDEPAAAFVGGKLLEHLRSDPAACAGRTVAVIPVANPDGLAAGTRTNAAGVDCNRNFPAANWKKTLWGRSNPGPRPASEPETRAVMKAIATLKPARIVSIHSGLRCNNYDGPGAAASDLASLLARYNDYPVQPGVGYPTPGSFGSWAGTDLAIPVVTLELPRSNDGPRAWSENRDALLALIAAAPAAHAAPLDPTAEKSHN